MVDVLKKRIEQKIGKPVETRGDCDLVSNAILETLDVDISCSTLRRLYGLAPYTKPNSKTLNILAQFIGYKNYAHFSQNDAYREKIDLSQITYKAVSVGDEQAILELVQKTKKSPENFIGFIVLLTRELFHNQDYHLLDELFKLKALSYSRFSYSEALYLGNSIGLLLRKQAKVDPVLLNNTNFLACVYLTFVDYSSLNGYYGEWTENIDRTHPKSEISIFTFSILEFRNFLNQKPVKEPKGDLIYSNQLNPILCSRLLALKLLVNETDHALNTTEVLNTYFDVHSKKSTLLDYSYELFTTAILTKNLLLMKYLIEKINLDTKIEFYYQKYHLNSFYLMCMFYFKYTKNNTEEKKYNRLFSIDACRYSYEDFITILHQVYLFGTTKTVTKKKLIKKTYTNLSTQLNHPYFSEFFLLNYFN
ncbi:MAG: Uncharacterised protein [Formosa sp. Hel1_33_131]|nr:MAG: Uncharacterised protein [Formosa sp. Hel1_33_131]